MSNPPGADALRSLDSGGLGVRVSPVVRPPIEWLASCWISRGEAKRIVPRLLS